MGIDFVTATELHPLVCYKRGKVRDIYEVGDRLLIVATDRISAFDVVLPTGIPDKGRVLTELSRFWFSRTRDIVPNLDEVLTPDSSRFWPKEEYAAGRPQRSFDKQVVRDHLESLSWNKRPPAPPLPPEVVARTRARYLEALGRLTGLFSAHKEDDPCR